MIDDKRLEAMIEEIDEAIGNWSRDKLECTILRAKMYLRRLEGRPEGSATSNKHNDAIRNAAHNVRQLEKADPKSAEKHGWQTKTIRAQIDADPDLKQNLSTVRAVRYALRNPIKRVKAT